MSFSGDKNCIQSRGSHLPGKETLLQMAISFVNASVLHRRGHLFSTFRQLGEVKRTNPMAFNCSNNPSSTSTYSWNCNLKDPSWFLSTGFPSNKAWQGYSFESSNSFLYVDIYGFDQTVFLFMFYFKSRTSVASLCHC